MARQAASRANAHDVETPPETTWILSGPRDTELRFDDREITVRKGHETRWIAWDDVRWFRDGEYFHLSRRLRKDGCALVITLKDGSVVIPGATRKPRQYSKETLTAARQAARHHAIPTVLTGRPVSDKPSPADKPGLPVRGEQGMIGFRAGRQRLGHPPVQAATFTRQELTVEHLADQVMARPKWPPARSPARRSALLQPHMKCPHPSPVVNIPRHP